MPIFTANYVILEHDHPILHWDFMLEKEASLHTWRLSHPPHQQGLITAQRLADHRLAYLEYEGPVSGDRGEVQQWDRGTYQLVEDSSERIEVRLDGNRLHGTAVIQKGPGEDAWEFTFTADDC